MGVKSKIQAMRLEIKSAIRNALEYLAESIDTGDAKTTALEALRDTGGMMVYKGTGNALPASPKAGWVFKVNATSAAVTGAPVGAANGDYILYNGTAWELMVDVSFGA